MFHRPSLFRRWLTVALVAMPLAWAGIAGAAPTYSVTAPTYYVYKGQTTLNFSPNFFNLLPALGAMLNRIVPAQLKGNYNNQNIRAVVPVTSGVVSTTGNVGEILHSGGLTLGVNTTTLVQLTGLTLEFDQPNSAGSRIVSALVNYNGNSQGRLPVFLLGTATLGAKVQNGQLNIRNVPISLSAEFAAVLNSVFRLPSVGGGAFYAGFPAGTLTVKGQSAKMLTRM